MTSADGLNFDAIVIGGGHNGLVAGFYLARAGMRPLILERRGIVGGCCVTEQFADGFHASTASHVLSMLRESIWRDMRLVERGVRVDAAGPTLTLFEDGSHHHTYDDLARTAEETRRFSTKDATRTIAFDEHVASLAKAIMPLYDRTPPDPRLRTLHDFKANLKLGRELIRHRGRLQDLAYMFTTSTSQFLSEWFESEHIKSTHAWTSAIDTFSGPSTPGTAFHLLHDHAGGGAESDGVPREWGFVRGGMGTVTAAMRDAAVEAGAVVRTESEVERIILRGGRAVGVALADGEELYAPRILSNADPQRTFLRMIEPDGNLPPDFVSSIRNLRATSTSLRIHLGVSDLPYARDLPEDGVQDYHRGFVDINPLIAELDFQQAQARTGVAADPAQMEICFPTVHDPSMAPEGKHVIDIVVISQPYDGPDWDNEKEDRADRAVAQIARHFPKLPELIEHRQVLSPVDQERRFGMTKAHYAHGEMAPDQLLFMRPARGFGDYRSPIGGLYLCGAGTHPGGGVTGANGRNAAREVLRDAARKHP